MFVVADTHKDERFKNNPWVKNPPHVRFYAGVTIYDRKTHMPVGAFCIKDVKSRELSNDETNILLDHAKMAEDEINVIPKPDGKSQN